MVLVSIFGAGNLPKECPQPDEGELHNTTIIVGTLERIIIVISCPYKSGCMT